MMMEEQQQILKVAEGIRELVEYDGDTVPWKGKFKVT